MRNLVFLTALGALAIGCNKETKVDVGGDAAIVVPSAAELATAVPAATAAAAGAKPPNACELMTAAELGAAIGAPLGAGTSTPGASSVSACSYTATGSPVTLTLRTEIIDKAGFEKTLATLRGGEKLSGLGDDAYFHLATVGPVGVGSLLVYKGKTLLSVTYGDMDLKKDKALATEKQLAEKILPKL